MRSADSLERTSPLGRRHCNAVGHLVLFGTLMLLCSCGSICAVAMESSCYRTPFVFPGIRFDAATICEQFASSDTPAGKNAGGCMSRGSAVVFLAIDLPFSFVGDIILMLAKGIKSGFDGIDRSIPPPETPDTQPKPEGKSDESQCLGVDGGS